MSARQPSLKLLTFAIGNLLIVVGLALSLAALVLVTVGPPTGWLGEAAELATPMDDSPVTGEMSSPRSDAAHRGGSEALAAPPTSGPSPSAPAPSVSHSEPPMRPAAKASGPSHSAAVPEAAAAPTAPASGPSFAEPPYLPITRILIPGIRLATDVAPAKLMEREGALTWQVPPFLAGHAEATAGAGGLGNAVLLGHVTSRNAGNVFQQLGRVQVGDRVQVFSDADEFDYRVVEMRTVPRTDVSILRPTRMARLSLITCAGTWLPLLHDYTQRLVVIAELTGPVGAPPVPLTPVPPVAVLATPVATASIAQSTPAVAPKLTTVFEERFADNRWTWPNDPLATAWFADGAYVLSAREPGRFVAIGAPIRRPLRDVVVTGTFRKVGGPPGGGYGLIVRDQGTESRDGINQSGRYYVLEVGDRGELGIWRREEDRWVDLLPWSPSDTVRPGTEPNELTVRAIGPRLTFVVNGVQAASLEDSALSAGGVGVFLGGDFNEARLERLVVLTP